MNDQRELRDVPVYTLPEYVLFPHTLVPLHVTEPDQIQLAEECLAGDRQMVIAGLQPGWEDFFEVAAPIYRTGCLAKIVNEERIQNGSISLFVHGLSRAVIHHQVQTEPYRTAHIELVPDQIDPHRELQREGLCEAPRRPRRRRLVVHRGPAISQRLRVGLRIGLLLRGVARALCHSAR